MRQTYLKRAMFFSNDSFSLWNSVMYFCCRKDNNKKQPSSHKFILQMGRQTNRQTYIRCNKADKSRPADIQTGQSTETERQTDRQTDIKTGQCIADKQTGRQACLSG